MRHDGGDLYIAHPADPWGYALAYGFLRQLEPEGLNLHHGFVPPRDIESIALTGRADAVWLPAPLLPFAAGRWETTPHATWLAADREPVLVTREPILPSALTSATLGFSREYGMGALLAGLCLPDARFEHCPAAPVSHALADGQCLAVVLEPEELSEANGFYRTLPLGAWWRESQPGTERLPGRVLAVRADLPPGIQGRLRRCIDRALAAVRDQPEAASAFAAEQTGGGAARGTDRAEELFGLARDHGQWQQAWQQLWTVAAAAGRLPEPELQP